VRRGLFWLAVVDLRQTWLRSSLAVLAIALAIIAVAFFVSQIDLRQAEVLAAYDEAGAATFVTEFEGVRADLIEALADSLRSLPGVRSVELPFSGVRLDVAADVSFLVFENEVQKEYLGATTSVLGVDRAFDPARDYYVDFHDMNPSAPRSVLGIPLIATSGTVRPPEDDEVVVASGVTDYVGVRPGAKATVDLVYEGVNPPIVHRLEGLRLIGTFDAVGPDQGRFDPFWRFAARGREVLTVRRPDAAEGVTTTLPVLLGDKVVREFVAEVEHELAARGIGQNRPLAPDRLAIRANSIADVPSVMATVNALLRRGLAEGCENPSTGSFCLRLPEHNNFQMALQEQKKLGAGGWFFVSLLLALVVVGAAGWQVQTVLAHWRDFGILQAVGFSRGQILRSYAIRLCILLAVSIGIAVLTAFLLPAGMGGSYAPLATAAILSVVAASLAALPVLLWPLVRPPAELIQVSA
jgi:hypothetical protein